MDEVFKIADKITVFRDGKHIATVPASELDRQKLIALMVGRELTHMFPKEHAQIGEVVLSVRDLTRHGVISDVSFDLRKGEILGLAGLMGAGRTEVIEAIFGVTKVDAGEILIRGKKVRIKSPSAAISAGMGLLTEDRKLTGIMGVLSVRDNMTIANLQRFSPGGSSTSGRWSGRATSRGRPSRSRRPALAADQEPVRREPAEGARVALADDAARHPDDRRAHARHRRRRQVRDPPADVAGWPRRARRSS